VEFSRFFRAAGRWPSMSGGTPDATFQCVTHCNAVFYSVVIFVAAKQFGDSPIRESLRSNKSKNVKKKLAIFVTFYIVITKLIRTGQSEFWQNQK
jgi:hypothetical protein